MHESHLVSDLVTRAEAELGPGGQRVTRLTLRVGALAPTSPPALKAGLEDHTAAKWGYIPEIVVDRAVDIEEPGALGVTLTSIQVEV